MTAVTLIMETNPLEIHIINNNSCTANFILHHQALFDNTCALREKRLDIEELMAEEKKTAEALKKETDALIKKQKIIENGLKTAEADLEQFQVSFGSPTKSATFANSE